MCSFNLVLLSFVFCFLLDRRSCVDGLVCYECRSSGGITHEAECSPTMERSSECDKKYCTIYRREYVDPSGKIDEFHRSCEDRPAYLNAVIKTPNHVAYYRSCQQNLCNVGDGLVPSARALIQSDDSDTEILVVPGIGSSGDRRVSYSLWLLHGLALVLILARPYPRPSFINSL